MSCEYCNIPIGVTAHITGKHTCFQCEQIFSGVVTGVHLGIELQRHKFGFADYCPSCKKYKVFGYLPCGDGFSGVADENSISVEWPVKVKVEK